MARREPSKKRTPPPGRTKPTEYGLPLPEEVPATVPTSTDREVEADPQEIEDRSLSEYESDAARETGEPRPHLRTPPELPDGPVKKKKKVRGPNAA